MFFAMLCVFWCPAVLALRSSRAFSRLPRDVTNSFPGEARLLGRGMYGEAWKVYDSAREQYVVVKVFMHQGRHLTRALAEKNAAASRALESAVRECQVARDMQAYAHLDARGSGRLMRCYEEHITDRDEDEPVYVVLEFCGDRSLRQWILENSDADFDDIKDLWRQLNEGLAYLTNKEHSRKWAHHDLKSDNVMVDHSDTSRPPVLKIIDFGGVQEVSTRDKRNVPIASPMYAPPELYNEAALQESPVHSFDAFSAASILVEMLSAHPWLELKFAECMAPAAEDNAIREDEIDLVRKQCDTRLSVGDLVEGGSPKHVSRLMKVAIYAHANRFGNLDEDIEDAQEHVEDDHKDAGFDDFFYDEFVAILSGTSESDGLLDFLLRKAGQAKRAAFIDKAFEDPNFVDLLLRGIGRDVFNRPHPSEWLQDRFTKNQRLRGVQ